MVSMYKRSSILDNLATIQEKKPEFYGTLGHTRKVYGPSQIATRTVEGDSRDLPRWLWFFYNFNFFSSHRAFESLQPSLLNA